MIKIFKIKNEKNFLIRVKTEIYKKVFFNEILRVSNEAYFEFYIFGMMNIFTAEYRSSGEIFGISHSFFVLFMIFGVCPSLSIFVICKSKDELEKVEIKQRIGDIYDGLKIENKF
jgi:hypothetical protein